MKKSTGKKVRKDVRDRIVEVLLREASPVSIYYIAKKLNVSPSSVLYQLGKLVDAGIVLKTDDGYILQPMFYYKEFWDELAEEIIRLFDFLEEYSVGNPDLIELLHQITKILTKTKNKVGKL